MEQVQAGSRRGLCYEAKELWEEAGEPSEWNRHPTGTREQKKEHIRRAAKAITAKRRKNWLRDESGRNGDYHKLMPEKGKPAEHTNWGTKEQIGLMATTRAAACALRGNKVAADTLPLSETACTECPNHNMEAENEEHIMLSCEAYEIPRAVMDAELEEAWGPKIYQRYKQMTKKQKKMTLLGSKQHINGGQEERKRRDAIVKKFLQTINEQRKNEQNQPDLRGAFCKITEFSLEEAIQWEKEVDDVEKKKE